MVEVKVINVSPRPKIFHIPRSFPDLTVFEIIKKGELLGESLRVHISNLNHKVAPISINSEFFIMVRLKSSRGENLYYIKVSCKDTHFGDCELLKSLSRTGRGEFIIDAEKFSPNAIFYPFIPDDAEVKIVVDSDDNIQESNESNNSKTWTEK